MVQFNGVVKVTVIHPDQVTTGIDPYHGALTAGKNQPAVFEQERMLSPILFDGIGANVLHG
jgi:hypothetical protein